MKKAVLFPGSEKVQASDYEVEVHLNNGNIDTFECTNYTYNDVFEVIKERYEENSDLQVNELRILLNS